MNAIRIRLCVRAAIVFLLLTLLPPTRLAAQKTALDGQTLVVMEADENPKAVGLYVKHVRNSSKCSHIRATSRIHLGEGTISNTAYRTSMDALREAEKRLAAVDPAKVVVQGLTGHLAGVEFQWNAKTDPSGSGPGWMVAEQNAMQAGGNMVKKEEYSRTRKYPRKHKIGTSIMEGIQATQVMFRIAKSPDPDLVNLVVTYAEPTNGKPSWNIAPGPENEAILGALTYRRLVMLDLQSGQVLIASHVSDDSRLRDTWGYHKYNTSRWVSPR